MQRETIIKWALTLSVGAVSAMAVAQVVSSSPLGPMNRQGQATKNINEKAQRALNAMFRKVDKEEKDARQFLKERRFAEAEQACRRAIALSPKWNGKPMASTAIRLLGDIFREQGRYKEAIKAYPKSLKRGTYSIMDLNIALCYLKLGHLENAPKCYNKKKYFGGGSRPLSTEETNYIAQLPGTRTPKAFEASILFARGCEKDSVAQREDAIADFKKVLVLAPHNALAAYNIAWDLGSLYRSNEAPPYWARAAVFGKGETAREGRIRLRNILMPDKAEQALRDARKIKA